MRGRPAFRLPFAGDRIKRERLRFGLTQRSLAEISGYSKSEINRAEVTGFMSMEIAFDLAQALETETGAFLAPFAEALQ